MSTMWKLALALAVAAALPGTGEATGQSPPDAAWSSLVPRIDSATHYYAAPDGKPANLGTRAAPWDLSSALSGQHKVVPGDVIWVRGGTYKERGQLQVGLVGREDAPLI